MSDSYQTPDFLLKKFADLIQQKSGIVFFENHFKVLDQRIQSYINDFNCSEQELLNMLMCDDQKLTLFIGHVTTNHTHFFRSIEQFKTLGSIILPELIEKNKNSKNINIWSAACSSGEEPYTIALYLTEYFISHNLKNWNFSILATDIDNNSLQTAKNGVYPLSTLKYIPEIYHQFLTIENGTENHLGFVQNSSVTIPEKIKNTIHFKQHNLLEKINEKKMDIIFCRNVLIYFDEKTQQKVVSNLIKNLSPNCYFFISPTESLNNITTELTQKIVPNCIFYINKNN